MEYSKSYQLTHTSMTSSHRAVQHVTILDINIGLSINNFI